MGKKASSSSSTRGTGESGGTALGAGGAAVPRQGGGWHREMLRATQVWCCT